MAATTRESTPPPVIGKMGPYTVFLTPPSAEKPAGKVADSPEMGGPPPVQPPPRQFHKPCARTSSSVFGVFWDAIAKVQDVHSSLDEYLAEWLGLNQSKYQWALNDYYESKGIDNETGKLKKAPKKVQGM